MGPNGRHASFGDHSFGDAWDDYAGAGMRLKPTIHNGLRAELDGAGAVGRAPAGTAGHLAFDKRHRYGSRSGEAGAHWHYEHVTCDEYGARAKTAGVAKPTDLAMVTRPVELYPSAGIPKQGSGTTEVMPSDDIRQHHQSPSLCTKLEPLDMVVGTSSMDHNDIWAATRCFCSALGSRLHPEVREMRPLVESVKVSQLNQVAPLSRPTAAPTDVKLMCPLIKLQLYGGSGSLETFLMKFWCMPALEALKKHPGWSQQDAVSDGVV